MPKMFGFNHRRMKLGRLKGHLGDPLQGAKSPMRPTKRLAKSNEELKEQNAMMASASGRSDDFNSQLSPDDSHLNMCIVGTFDNWMMLSTSGDKPTPRFHHAAAVVGSKMVVVGGESGHGMLDDTMILNLDKLTWAAAAPKVYLSAAGLPLKIPSCRGHCLVSWGKRVLLIGGKMDPSNDKVSVWSFDLEAEYWSNVEAKGDIPVARSGHTVIRAGPVLILFGGEDSKGRKLNDLHMFDLKSLMWLPLHYTGTGPSPRSNHVAALYGDKILLVFGGQAKSRILNDLYSLDFETMVWTRLKTKGYHPSPRAGCCGAFYGSKWYIMGGGSKKKRYPETLVFDVLKCEWSVCAASQNASITANKGFSLVTMHHKDKMFLVAFGGNKKEPSNQIEILVMVKNEHATSWRSASDADPIACEDFPRNTKELASHLRGPPPRFIDSIARNGISSAVDHHVSGRKSLSDSSSDPNPLSGVSSLCKQFHNEEECNSVLKIQKSTEDGKLKESDDFLKPNNSLAQVMEHRGSKQETTVHMDIAGILTRTEENILTVDYKSSLLPQKQESTTLVPGADHIIPLLTEDRGAVQTNPSNIQLYEAKIATLARKNSLLEGQLAAALTNQEAAEKNFSLVTKSKQDMERKLADTVKEVELLKEKLAGLELVQEEANSLSNIVHSDNVRLEHDVAFLKAVLDDTQKELHSTRGVLAGERARAFQLQVEVFHLKQRLQSVENRAPTPRKPYHM